MPDAKGWRCPVSAEAIHALHTDTAIRAKHRHPAKSPSAHTKTGRDLRQQSTSTTVLESSFSPYHFLVVRRTESAEVQSLKPAQGLLNPFLSIQFCLDHRRILIEK
jgi:hypothetical protein